MKHQSGQGLVEYALILVLVAVIVFVTLALLLGANKAPPNINAPLQEIIDYCQDQAEYTTTTMIGDVPVVNHHFDEDEFNQCLSKYEYRIER